MTSNPFLPFPWQDDRRIKSGDRVWILTDTHSYESAMYGQSIPQRWHRVGGLDLRTMRLGYFTFSTDDVRAAIKDGAFAPAPWKAPQAHGIEVTRFYHGPKKQGRFRQKVSLIDLDPELVKRGPALRAYFTRTLSFKGNSESGMWKEIEAGAKQENAIEAAALSLEGWFSAGRLKAIVGSDVNVTPTLTRLVSEGLLLSNGKKTRAARYMVAPPAVSDRADWAQ